MNKLAKIIMTTMTGSMLASCAMHNPYLVKQATTDNGASIEYMEKMTSGRKVCMTFYKDKNGQNCLLDYNCDEKVDIKKEKANGEADFKSTRREQDKTLFEKTIDPIFKRLKKLAE